MNQPYHQRTGTRKAPGWARLASDILAFVIFYGVCIVLFALVYFACRDIKTFEQSLLFSIDTVVCRGRSAETGFCSISLWASAAQAMMGHLGPAIAIGLIFSLFPTR
jgi:hypothetical protein